MASGKRERALAAQGSERPLGESTSTRDVTEMKGQTGKIAVRSPSAGVETSTQPPSPGTSKTCRKVYNRMEQSAGGTLGPTRAMIDMRKQRLRQNRAAKLQSLNSAKQEVEKLHAGVDQMFEELESTLLTHPAHPSVHVQTCSDEFNIKSVQLQQLQQKISVMKNELQLIDRIVNRRSESVIPRQQVTTCTTSRQFSNRESDPIPEVCGFPICENPFHQLSDTESNIEGQFSVIPVEVKAEEKNEEEVISLIDPRKSREQKIQSECSKTVNPVAEPVVSVQNVKDTVQEAPMQHMTEQAAGLKTRVPAQHQINVSDPSVQTNSSTEKSVYQSSLQSVQKSAAQSAHKGAVLSRHEDAAQSTHTGAILQKNIPLPMPTLELRPRCPPTFYGKYREDVSRWISYMGNYLSFMQGTPDQQVSFAVTYIRGPALEWWDQYVKESGYPTSWTVMSKALRKRFGQPFRAKEAQARIMNIRQGKRKIREYSNEFLTLLNRLASYDESWMVNIYIWGLQPHFAKYVSANCPGTVSEAIKIAEETEFSIWASQKDHLTKQFNGQHPSKQRKGRAAKDNHQQQQRHPQHQNEQQNQNSFEDQIPQTTRVTSTTQDSSRDLYWAFDDSM